MKVGDRIAGLICTGWTGTIVAIIGGNKIMVVWDHMEPLESPDTPEDVRLLTPLEELL